MAPPSDRPLTAQRLVLAKILFEVLKAHGVSRSRFADMIGVNEKQVRKMLDGRSPVPMATLGVMPVEMALDFVDALLERRGARRTGMQAEIDRLARDGDLDAVHDAQRQLLEVASRMASRGRR